MTVLDPPRTPLPRARRHVLLSYVLSQDVSTLFFTPPCIVINVESHLTARQDVKMNRS